MNGKEKFGLAVGILLVLGVVGLFMTVKWVTVEGSERVVWQTYGGVKKEVSPPGMHFYFGWTTTPYTYYTGSETFVIDDKTVNPANTFMDKKELEMNQPDVQPVEIPVMMESLTAQDIEDGKTTGPTPVLLRCVMQYHVDSKTLVKLHNDKTTAFRTTFLKDVLLQNIIDNTTILDARTIYQGAGRVTLQTTIETALREEPLFDEYGIVVERFILREITLKDATFLDLITKEAQAQQKRKTAIKEQAAADAEALVAEAQAKAEQLKRLVEANTKKGEEIARAQADAEKEVLKAEAAKKQVVLAAEAQAQQVVLAAEAQAKQVEFAANAKKIEITLAAEAQKSRDELEGEGLKLRKLAESEGVLALGKATAEAKKLMLVAYEGEGGRRFAEVEKARSLGEGISKIYYIPPELTINAIAKDFDNAVTVALPHGE